ncbi:MAG: LamG domain-containing protein [bacterium]
MPKKNFIIATAFLTAAAGITLFLFFNTRETKGKANITSGLVGYWKMDESAWSTTGAVRDSSPSGINGTASGATSTAYAKYGRAGTFDGSNDSVNFGTASAHQIVNDLTISAWVYPRGTGMVLAEDAFGDTAATNVLYWMAVSPGAGGYIGYFWETDAGTDHVLTLSTNSIPSNAWSHIIITRKQNGTTDDISFYLNGGLLQTYTGQVRHGATEGTSAKLSIGRKLSSVGPYEFLNAIIDEVRIYNRALSATEIATLYGSARINSAPKNQLVGYWTMDNTDRSRNLIYDKSGFNNNGILIGTATSTGMIKQARSFNGTTNYIDGTANSILLIKGDITLSAWIKAAALTTYGGIFARYCAGDTEACNYPYFLETQSDGDISVGHEYGAGSDQYYRFNTNLSANTWHYVAGVRNTSNKTWQVFADGIAYPAQSYTNDATGGTSSHLWLGVDDNTGGTYFNGAIDDARVYNYALSAQDVSQLYSAAKITHIDSANKTGLVGYWTMDNTDRSRNLIYDTSGFNNNGILIGTATSTGMIKQARSFNGTTDYINVGSNARLNIVTFSWSMWIKRSETTFTNERALISNEGGGSDTNGTYAMQIDVGAGVQDKIQLGVHGVTSFWSDIAITDKNWHFIVATRNSSSNGTIYIDGVSHGTGSLSAKTAYSGTVIGKGHSAYSLFYGNIDDVRIFNRALSAQEVANLYNASKLFRSQ